MIDVKTLETDDLRAAHTLFRAALHHGPAIDEHWEQIGSRTFPPGRTFGGYSGGTLAGTTMSFLLPMTVPGGAVLPSAAVTRVGVRADQTRRGVLTALMREQLASFAAAGEPIASLRASEYPIYGRFGYGVASRGLDVIVDRLRATVHPAAPGSVGNVRLLDRADFDTVLPRIYRRLLPGRAGMLERDDAWWWMNLNRPGREEQFVAAVHAGPDGDDGFVLYHPERAPSPDDPWAIFLQVDDMHTASVEATAALWRFLLRVDVTNEVHGWLRPLDEPLHLLLADPRMARTSRIGDEAWLRLVDVPVALSARSWAGSDAVVLGVRDALLPTNSGGYRIGPDGVSRTDEAPQLECDVAVLGRLYLGDVAPSRLAATGWLSVHDPAALPAADALFATGSVPWSGTFF